MTKPYKPPKGFRYKKLRQRLPDAPLEAIRTRREIEDEGLTGYVHGQPAGSQDEERFARSFDKLGISFAYQTYIPTDYSLPNNDKKVDFILEGIQPFEPYGGVHFLQPMAQEAHDRVRELQLNEVFRRAGLRDLKIAKYTEYAGGQERVDNYTRRNLL